MQLNILKDLVNDYRLDLKDRKELKHLYFWEIAERWKDHWDPEAPDFCEMFNKCLDSNISRKLWKDEKGDAKKMLMDLMALDPEFARRTFKGFLNEEKDLSIRVSHFQFGCDVLMEEFKTRNKTSILTDHLHGNPFYPMLYLFFIAPEKYCFYFHGAFKTFMNRIKAHPVYDAPDVLRFQKVIKTISHFLLKDAEIQESFSQLIPKQYVHLDPAHFLAGDFYRWVAEQDRMR